MSDLFLHNRGYMKLKLALVALFFLNLNIKTSEKKIKNVNDFKKHVISESFKTAVHYSWCPPVFYTLKECAKLNVFSSHKPPLHSVKELAKIYGKHYFPFTVAFWIGGTLYHAVKN